MSPSDDSDTSEDPSPVPTAIPADVQVYLEEDEEEVFQTHGLCPYPCPYANYLLHFYADTMDLSDISGFEDIMIKSSDEDIPALEDTPY